MAQTETFMIIVDGTEAGTAEVIARPSSDLIDAIGNKRVQMARSGDPYQLVNYEIGRMVTGWSIHDDDGRELRFPQDTGKLPAGARKVLYERICEIVNPLLPNLGGAS